MSKMRSARTASSRRIASSRQVLVSRLRSTSSNNPKGRPRPPSNALPRTTRSPCWTATWSSSVSSRDFRCLPPRRSPPYAGRAPNSVGLQATPAAHANCSDLSGEHRTAHSPVGDHPTLDYRDRSIRTSKARRHSNSESGRYARLTVNVRWSHRPRSVGRRMRHYRATMIPRLSGTRNVTASARDESVALAARARLVLGAPISLPSAKCYSARSRRPPRSRTTISWTVDARRIIVNGRPRPSATCCQSDSRSSDHTSRNAR